MALLAFDPIQAATTTVNAIYKRDNSPASDLNKQYKEISVKDTNTTKEKSHAAAKQAGKALEAGFAEVKTPSQASDVLDRIDNAAGDTKEQDLPPAQGSVNPLKFLLALDIAYATSASGRRQAWLRLRYTKTGKPGVVQRIQLAEIGGLLCPFAAVH